MLALTAKRLVSQLPLGFVTQVIIVRLVSTSPEKMLTNVLLATTAPKDPHLKPNAQLVVININTIKPHV